MPTLGFGTEGFRRADDAALLAPYWYDCDPVQTLLEAAVALNGLLREVGHRVAYPMPDDTIASAAPYQFEIARLLAAGAPCLPVSVLLLDPLIHDIGAIDLRSALDWLRDHDPGLYAAAIRFATRHVKLRDFCTISDQYEVIPARADNETATPDWSFGPVAVFVHAYYAEMMPELWEILQRLPLNRLLFITTASLDNAEAIRAFLNTKGWPEEAADVRVVAQNRGRDMSSLFITWRDAALSGKYQVALRLHSKRTPQLDFVRFFLGGAGPPPEDTLVRYELERVIEGQDDAAHVIDILPFAPV